ncbi:MAG: 3-deoxy-7-phosphoheptulonate synthase, Tyr-sensitive [Candidatus Westeberhardia cardiocondylae]|nr:3-deoxy-7-phosphoheptulonate synthase, Tyr-sensitive [Candidatus Westeberhardia cardiocondylae]
MNNKKNNTFYNNETTIITPKKLKKNLPINKNNEEFIYQSRNTIKNIIHGKESKILIICGPCSIHDTNSAIDYAHHLYKLSNKIKEKIYLVMRTYFEKPRTTVGWKGFINDPYIDDSYNIEQGLHMARALLLQLTDMKIPLATEALDIITPQYLSDLFSWSAIGARTSESQIHREMASGLPMPIGFKNNTDGNIDAAINSIISSSQKHCYLGINQNGQICTIKTQGNPNSHIILRGGYKPNYHTEDIAQCTKKILKANLQTSIMIDCSHGNSNKNYKKQELVAKSVLKNIKNKKYPIIGIMLESHIHEGNQPANINKKQMKYGVSITDACINWENTEKIILQFYNEL